MDDSTTRVLQQHPTPQYIWLLRDALTSCSPVCAHFLSSAFTAFTIHVRVLAAIKLFHILARRRAPRRTTRGWLSTCPQVQMMADEGERDGHGSWRGYAGGEEAAP
ncbi:hypothetical protein C8J57DRAFT_1545098 [Mycena rebaudengoi]|nr:hypothetical protein C8J57DRAFT_1545098 [Mycena rebaudengoi]